MSEWSTTRKKTKSAATFCQVKLNISGRIKEKPVGGTTRRGAVGAEGGGVWGGGFPLPSGGGVWGGG